MIDTARAIWDLSRLCWTTDPGKFFGALVLVLIEAVALPAAAPLLGALTDAALAGDATRAAAAGTAIAILAIAALTGAHFAHVLYFDLGARAFLRLNREVIELANASAGLEHHERAEYGDRVRILCQELNRVATTSINAMLTGMSMAVAISLTAVLLARLSPWLLLLPFAAVPPLLAGRGAESIAGAHRRRAAAHSAAAQHMLDLAKDATAAKELRVFDLCAQVQARHAEHWSAATRMLWKGEVQGMLVRAGGQLVFALVYVGATLLVVREVIAGDRSVGDVVLAIVLGGQVSQQVTSAVTLLRELQRLAETLADLRWIRALVARLAPPAGRDEPPHRLADGIRLRDVTFAYPGTREPVLRHVDLHLPAGSIVAIVGENGAGKTTLVKLLCRLYEPTAGVIELDGADIRQFDLGRWRRRISAAFQDFSRFELAARQTVGVGDLPHVDDDQAVVEALRRAQGADIVPQLARGLDTLLGRSLPEGVDLSGGQWQKLALGRAMMRTDPLLLLLDEPTAALDARVEHGLFERHARHARTIGERTGAITLLVSHRFSTVRMADLILVIAGSTVIEAGSHTDLMGTKGLYSELYSLQAAQYR
jgi:ATP-binding cassette subfamily B protein